MLGHTLLCHKQKSSLMSFYLIYYNVFSSKTKNVLGGTGWSSQSYVPLLCPCCPTWEWSLYSIKNIVGSSQLPRRDKRLPDYTSFILKKKKTLYFSSISFSLIFHSSLYQISDYCTFSLSPLVSIVSRSLKSFYK